MKRHWLIASIIALLAIGSAFADSLPINQLPMYGEREKNEAMKSADAAFVASIEKGGLSREDGAKQVIKSGWSVGKGVPRRHVPPCG